MCVILNLLILKNQKRSQYIWTILFSFMKCSSPLNLPLPLVVGELFFKTQKKYKINAEYTSNENEYPAGRISGKSQLTLPLR